MRCRQALEKEWASLGRGAAQGGIKLQNGKLALRWEDKSAGKLLWGRSRNSGGGRRSRGREEKDSERKSGS